MVRLKIGSQSYRV